MLAVVPFLQDLKRASIQFASAVFILANKFTDHPDAEDSNTILRALAIKKYVCRPALPSLENVLVRGHARAEIPPPSCFLTSPADPWGAGRARRRHCHVLCARESMSWFVGVRFVFSQTGRDISTFVQLIRPGSQPLFLSSVERFMLAHNRSMAQAAHGSKAVRGWT